MGKIDLLEHRISLRCKWQHSQDEHCQQAGCLWPKIRPLKEPGSNVTVHRVRAVYRTRLIRSQMLLRDEGTDEIYALTLEEK
jgi:hypothetical protein